MSGNEVKEDDPNYDALLQEANLPYEDVGNTRGTDVYILNGDGGVAVYRKFRLEGSLPGSNVEADLFYGVEVEHMTKDERRNAMLLRTENGDNVFEYRDGRESPEEVRDFGALSPVRNFRIRDMLNPEEE